MNGNNSREAALWREMERVLRDHGGLDVLEIRRKSNLLKLQTPTILTKILYTKEKQGVLQRTYKPHDYVGNKKPLWSLRSRAPVAYHHSYHPNTFNHENQQNQNQSHARNMQRDAYSVLLSADFESDDAYMSLSYELQRVTLEKPEYDPLDDAEIKTLFFKTVSKSQYQIDDIEDVKNDKQILQYEINLYHKCEQLKKPREQVEKYLFHGSSYDTLNVIIQNGFDRSYSTSAAYGSGTYFARDAQYSASGYSPQHSDGYQYMFLCKVIVGDWYQGSSGINRIPKKSDSTEYDTLVDNPSNPSIFVVWKDYCAVPMYRIKFKRAVMSSAHREASPALSAVSSETSESDASFLSHAPSSFFTHMASPTGLWCLRHQLGHQRVRESKGKSGNELTAGGVALRDGSNVVKLGDDKAKQVNTSTAKEREVKGIKVAESGSSSGMTGGIVLPDGDYYEAKYDPLDDEEIKTLFFKTVSKLQYLIDDIEDVKDDKQMMQYEINLYHKCEQLKKPREQVEKYLFHGSSYDTLNVIIQNGFDRSYSTTAMYGSGIYFARDAQYSASGYCPVHSDGYQYMFLCKVIAGESYQGSRGITRIPRKSDSTEYDTLVDNPSNPSIFVVWRDYCAVPMFRIKFKRKSGCSSVITPGGIVLPDGDNDKAKHAPADNLKPHRVHTLHQQHAENEDHDKSVKMPDTADIDQTKVEPHSCDAGSSLLDEDIFDTSPTHFDDESKAALPEDTDRNAITTTNNKLDAALLSEIGDIIDDSLNESKIIQNPAGDRPSSRSKPKGKQSANICNGTGSSADRMGTQRPSVSGRSSNGADGDDEKDPNDRKRKPTNSCYDDYGAPKQKKKKTKRTDEVQPSASSTLNAEAPKFVPRNQLQSIDELKMLRGWQPAMSNSMPVFCQQSGVLSMNTYAQNVPSSASSPHAYADSASTMAERSRKHPRRNTAAYNSNGSNDMKQISCPKPSATNVFISRKFTTIVIPQHIARRIARLFDYLKQTLPFCASGPVLSNQPIVCVVNYGFRSEQTREPLYYVIKCDCLNGGIWNWRMIEKLFDREQMAKMFNISVNQMPRPIARSQQISDIDWNALIQSTKWHQVRVFHRKENNARLTFSVTPQTLKQTLSKSMSDVKPTEQDLLEVMIFGDDDTALVCKAVITTVEWLGTRFDIVVCVSKMKGKRQPMVCGIHIHEELLRKAHLLAATDHEECKCTETFNATANTRIHALYIGNPDDQANRIRQLQKEIDRLKAHISDSSVPNSSSSETSVAGKYQCGSF